MLRQLDSTSCVPRCVELVHCIEVFDCEDPCIVANPELRGHHAFFSALQTFANCGAGGKQLYTWLVLVNHCYQKLMRQMSKLSNLIKNMSKHRSMQPAFMTAWMAVYTSAWPLVPGYIHHLDTLGCTPKLNVYVKHWFPTGIFFARVSPSAQVSDWGSVHFSSSYAILSESR